MPLVDPGEGGSGPEDVGEIIRRGHSGNTYIQFRDLDFNPPHDTYPGGVIPLGFTENQGGASEEMAG